MTVKELVQLLEKMPQDAPVIYSCGSEYTFMYADEIKTTDKPTKPFGQVVRFIERNDVVMEFSERQWDYIKDGQPKFLTVVIFPGN